MHPLALAAAVGLVGLSVSARKERVRKSRDALDFARRLRRSLQPDVPWHTPIAGDKKHAVVQFEGHDVRISRYGDGWFGVTVYDLEPRYEIGATRTRSPAYAAKIVRREIRGHS